MTDQRDWNSFFKSFRRIAVVGISPKPERASYHVAHYLKDKGFEVVGVRPGTSDIDGIPVYPTLDDVPGDIDIVDVFRSSEHVPQIAEKAIAVGAKVLWLQEGVTHTDAEQTATNAGLIAISNSCILKVHKAHVEPSS
jgi:predicted CoA-binding protein